MKKLIFVTPHLSTGGLPQYTARLIEMASGEYEVWCVEWDSITGGVLVVQRNKIQAMIGERLVTLADDKYEFLRLIDSIEPDIIHFQEIPETFVATDILDAVYYEGRSYEILVTTHSSYTNPSKIRYCADRFVLVSDWSRRRFAEEFGEARCEKWEYPLLPQVYDKEAAKARLGMESGVVHYLHVGLFTPGKNQRLIIEAARRLLRSGARARFHFVGNQADNFREYWAPLMADLPENCTWHGERHDVDEFYKAADVFLFPSLFELNPLSLKEAASFGLKIALNKLETYDGAWDHCETLPTDEEDAAEFLVSLTESLPEETDRLYSPVKRRPDLIRSIEPTINVNFINGPYVEIHDAPGDTFDVSIFDGDKVVYTTELGNGCWARANMQYAKDWLIRAVRRSDGAVFERYFEPKGKRIFVALESKSIGDTLAWFPQVVEFMRLTGCHLVCSTFWNDQFRHNYPEIEFVHPGAVVHGIYAMFSIGWFYQGDGHCPLRHPREFRTLPLGQTAADILNIKFRHLKANLGVGERLPLKRIGLGIHSTAQTKYWNNPTGWQELTDFLKVIGYEVIVLSNEGDGYMGNSYPSGATVHPSGGFEELKQVMSTCEAFVGIGSGLSWLAWTLGVPTVLISGFSRPESEFEDENVLRIFNEKSCNGCYNRYKFDAGDWNWCPDHAGTERQFECTKSITARHVIARMIESGFLGI